ncbi:unnamed protein product [Lactuca saligna]|uniref:Uncharacterized protein n=1 Tax=Lactuca saligna TaxID=75948 RepID=A0AA35ZCV5_LACSI|nr:unnamed protein product [Lactuca saligna]
MEADLKYRKDIMMLIYGLKSKIGFPSPPDIIFSKFESANTFHILYNPKQIDRRCHYNESRPSPHQRSSKHNPASPIVTTDPLSVNPQNIAARVFKSLLLSLQREFMGLTNTGRFSRFELCKVKIVCFLVMHVSNYSASIFQNDCQFGQQF